MTRDLSLAIGSAVFAAVIMTLGDFVWASQLLRHRMAYGLLHGAGLCLALGLALGAPAKRPLTGAIGGLVVGILSAASFYVLAPVMRYSAMFVSWVLLWILLALLDRMLQRGASVAVGADPRRARGGGVGPRVLRGVRHVGQLESADDQLRRSLPALGDRVPARLPRAAVVLGPPRVTLAQCRGARAATRGPGVVGLRG